MMFQILDVCEAGRDGIALTGGGCMYTKILRCHLLTRKQSLMMSLLHYLILTFSFEISSACTNINLRIGFMMLPPRHPRCAIRATTSLDI